MSRIRDYLLFEKKKYNKASINNIVNEASMDFWARVSEMVPDATTSDLDPGIAHKLEKEMAKAISSWIDYNVPD